jgi:hypothetical protein
MTGARYRHIPVIKLRPYVLLARGYWMGGRWKSYTFARGGTTPAGISFGSQKITRGTEIQCKIYPKSRKTTISQLISKNLKHHLNVGWLTCENDATYGHDVDTNIIIIG